MFRRMGMLLALVPLVAHAGWTPAGKLDLQSGVDTNPARTFGDLATPDATATFTGTASARCATGRLVCAARYVLGLRGFADQMGSNTLAQEGAVRLAVRIGRSARVGLEGSAKDVRGGNRPYDDLRLALFARDRLGTFDLSLEPFGRRFLYPPTFGESFTAFGLNGRALRHFGRHHALFVEGRFADRRLQMRATSDGTALGARRRDRVWSAGLGWSYRGPFSVEVGYLFVSHGSNARGESWTAHAVSASFGVRLPWKLLLLGRLHLELTHYADGIALSPELLLLEEGENLDAVALQLVRPVSTHVDLSLRWGLYQTRLPAPAFRYQRQVATFGVTYRF